MKKFFVTATGTDIGKTFIAATLVKSLVAKNKKVKALKPIISGFSDAEYSDTEILLQAQGLSNSETNINAISPWRFKEPISPDMASENVGKSIDFDQLVTFCKNAEADYVFIEGAGGVMTPITAFHTTLDWIAAVDCKIILVTGSYLGSLSHTLTAYEAIIKRRLKLHSLILNESITSPVTLERILLTLERFLPNDVPHYCIKRQNSEEDIKNIVL